MAIIRYAAEWDGVLAYDELSENLVLLKPIPGTRTPKSTFKKRPILDDDFIRAIAWFNRHGFPNIGKDKVIDAVETVAKETVISPIRHYLEDLETRIKWHPSTHSAKLHRCSKTTLVRSKTRVYRVLIQSICRRLDRSS